MAEVRWGPSRFRRFVEQMLDAGVLIDASRLLESAFDAVQLPNALGRSAAEAVWEAERMRAHELRAARAGDSTRLPQARAPRLSLLVDARRSSAGFGKGEVTLHQLAALLDGMYGLAAGPQAAVTTLSRRSTPSAGAFKALRISLILIQPAPDLAAGVYDVVFEGAGQVSLRRIGESGTSWCRALLDAHRWLLANGLLVVSADTTAAALKYKSRALHFALIETGAALQNAGLAAAELGIGFRVLGGYYADRLAQLCHLEAERVLGCAVFGSSTQDDESGTRPQRKAIRFDWAEAGDDNPVYIAGAEVQSTPASGIGWGRSTDARTACAIAISEAVERYSYSVLGRCVVASASQLEGAVDPTLLVRYSKSQYQRTDLGVHPFDAGKRYLWVPARQRASDKWLWVPAECVYSASTLPRRFASQAITRTTSSGCATDAQVDVAIERAAFEVIERDALARHWLAQASGTAVLRSSWPSEVADRIERLESLGCKVSIQVLDQQLGPVMMVVVESEPRGFSAIGTACGRDALSSLERALAEAEVVAAVRLQQDREPPINARDVRKPIEHSDLHAQRRHYKRARALTQGGEHEGWRSVERRWPRDLEVRLRADGGQRDLLWVDLTTRDAPLGADGQDLYTVRVLIPGAVPIGFGYDAIPRGTFSPVTPAARFPHPMA